MTSTILFLTLLALLVLLIVAYRGDFAEPSILFVVGFTLAVFNGLTNYRTWDFDLSMQNLLRGWIRHVRIRIDGLRCEGVFPQLRRTSDSTSGIR